MQLKQSNQELLQIEYLATAATGQNIVRDDGKDVIEGLTKTPKSLFLFPRKNWKPSCFGRHSGKYR